MNITAKGFSLVAAIFILVVFSLVGTYALDLSTRMATASELSVDGIRAVFASKSALEWATYQIVTNPASCFSPTTFNFTQQGLNHFNTQVSCTSASYTEGGSTFNIFGLTAVSSRGVTTDYDYITRTLAITAMVSTSP